MVKDKSKYSKASRKRMLAVPKAKRVELMRALGKKRQKTMTQAQRTQHAKAMVNAREAKRNKI